MIDVIVTEQLPEWAQRKADKDVLEGLQQLITKYPHKRGNATIIEIVYLLKHNEVQFIVGTDAGNIMKLTLNELYELYEPGEYILVDLPNVKLYNR